MKAPERRRDAMLRSALGASRWTLLRTAMMESAALVGLGAVAGVTLSYWLDQALVALFHAGSPNCSIDVAPNLRVLAFTCVAAATAFAVFGVVPAWTASYLDVSTINSVSTRIAGDRSRLRQTAIVSQVSLTLILVAVGALFTYALRELKAAPLGIALKNTISAQVQPLPCPSHQTFAGKVYYRTVLARAP
jgi:putative ABC transport system permease protein